MLTLLIWVLILALVFGIVVWAVQQLPLPAPFGNIAVAVLALVFVLIILSAVLGDMPAPMRLIR